MRKRERLSLDFWKFWAGKTISNLGSTTSPVAVGQYVP